MDDQPREFHNVIKNTQTFLPDFNFEQMSTNLEEINYYSDTLEKACLGYLRVFELLYNHFKDFHAFNQPSLFVWWALITQYAIEKVKLVTDDITALKTHLQDQIQYYPKVDLGVKDCIFEKSYSNLILKVHKGKLLLFFDTSVTKNEEENVPRIMERYAQLGYDEKFIDLEDRFKSIFYALDPPLFHFLVQAGFIKEIPDEFSYEKIMEHDANKTPCQSPDPHRTIRNKRKRKQTERLQNQKRLQNKKRRSDRLERLCSPSSSSENESSDESISCDDDLPDISNTNSTFVDSSENESKKKDVEFFGDTEGYIDIKKNLKFDGSVANKSKHPDNTKKNADQSKESENTKEVVDQSKESENTKEVADQSKILDIEEVCEKTIDCIKEKTIDEIFQESMSEKVTDEKEFASIVKEINEDVKNKNDENVNVEKK